MILTKEQLAAFKEAALPLMQWLSDNCHPHCTVIVDSGRAEVMDMSAPDTTDQSVIVCPHCGHRHDDSEDWSMLPLHLDDWGAGDCDKCGQKLEWSRTAIITYTTTKL